MTQLTTAFVSPLARPAHAIAPSQAGTIAPQVAIQGTPPGLSRAFQYGKTHAQLPPSLLNAPKNHYSARSKDKALDESQGQAQGSEKDTKQTTRNKSASGKTQDNLSFALSALTAAGVTAATTYPLSAAVSRAIGDDMRLPSRQDIALNGAPTSAARAAIQTGLVESIRPPIRDAALAVLTQLAETIARSRNADETSRKQTSSKTSHNSAANSQVEIDKACVEKNETNAPHDSIKMAAEVLALLATNLAVTLVTAPIENLAMLQNQSGKGIFSVLNDALKKNPSVLFSSVTSAFISMNISWSIRLYARLKANGNPEKEREISAFLASVNSPIKNFLKCVNARQMVQNESLKLAILGTLNTMTSRPLNTAALVGMNILLSAVVGTRMYHGIRDNLFNRLQREPSTRHPPHS